jgi:D-aspartate ligase
MGNLKSNQHLPWACLLGDISMVRALGKSGFRVAVATANPFTKSTRSRYCKDVVEIPGWQKSPEDTLTALINWAKKHDAMPVLFYQEDLDVLWLSRFRDRIRQYFRIVLPDRELVEDLVDKSRFYPRAAECGIPIPETQIISDSGLIKKLCSERTKFPCIIKPIIREVAWHRNVREGNQKALHIADRKELEEALEKLLDSLDSLIVQDAILGGEENILSYHAYVNEHSKIVMEFTGAKIRTHPRQYGSSTYLEIADDPEVSDLGRSVVEKLGFTGVLKVDFKRDEQSGKLFVLEVNPRFNLWHHIGMLAGRSIPEAVYRDCVGIKNVGSTPAFRNGTRWIRPRKDLRAFGEYKLHGQISAAQWLYQVLTADINEGFQFSDPGPTVYDILEIMRGRKDRDPRAGN